ncbi:MAG: hypothetical protein EHM21_01550 [Chloroflexi bacterium]|nr:MAG: hypothetical protein EHM21_01550 [Chloroflexota bacterium]
MRTIFPVLLIALSLGLPGCGPAAQARQNGTLPPENREPTSIVLYYRTSIPSATPVPPTPAPTTTPNLDPDDYFGGMVVSLDEVGQTIPLRVTQNFLLSLGSDYTWRISIDPSWVASQNMKITPLPGEQGVFIARQRGKAVLRAEGEPACRQAQPPCERPNVVFMINIIVE